MSLGRFARSGSIFLPRPVTRSASDNWPKCSICRRSVDAYGLENDSPSLVEVWARCGGQALDPDSGLPVHGEEKRHATLKSSVIIRKTAGWSQNRLVDILSRMAFFSDDAVSDGREFQQTLTHDGARKKHTV